MPKNFDIFLPLIHRSIMEFNKAVLLNVDIFDYIKPIVNEYYVLSRIENNIKELIQKECYETTGILFNEGKYIFAFNMQKKMMSFHRLAVYLHNKYSNSLETKFSEIVSSVLDLQYMDWTNRQLTNNNLSIPIESFDLLFNLDSPDEPKLTDFDIKLILDRIKKSNNGEYLFRGINSQWGSNDGISASNYRNHKEFVDFDVLQKHEQEIVNRLWSYENYPYEKRLNALADLRHDGKDTNIIDFSKNFKASLFFACSGKSENVPELFILPKKYFEIMKDIDYPVEKDYLVYPEQTGEHKKRIKAQKSVFVYCHRGYLPRDEYDGIIENILIPGEAIPLFLKYSGFKDSSIYPDVRSFLDNPENFKTSASKLLNPDEPVEFLNNTLNYINPKLTKFPLTFFLDMEIENFEEINDCDYFLVRNIDPKYLKNFFTKSSMIPHYTGEISEDIKFILSCKNNFLDINAFVNKLNSNDQISPFLTGIDRTYMDYFKPCQPKSDKLQITLSEFNDIVLNSTIKIQIIKDPNIQNGTPIINGTNYSVRGIIELVKNEGFKKTLQNFPTLTNNMIKTAMQYAKENPEVMDFDDIEGVD